MPMALLPYVDEKNAPPRVREMLEKTQVKLNIFRMLCNSEAAAGPFVRLGNALLTRAQLDAKLRELAVLRVAKLTGSVYEWTQHVPIAKACQVSDEQVAAIERWEEAGCFNELERLVLRLTDEVTRDIKGGKQTFAALAQRLDPTELVELVVSIGFWGMVARILETLEVDLEDFAGKVNMLPTLGKKVEAKS